MSNKLPKTSKALTALLRHKAKPCLYNTILKEYSNRDAKRKPMAETSSAFGVTGKFEVCFYAFCVFFAEEQLSNQHGDFVIRFISVSEKLL